ncbi:MAG: DUF1569 domain-containing protein [Ferruginibacter sp.]
MKNLFDTAAYNEIKSRLNSLSPQSTRIWGKMDVAQMLAHCKAAFMVPLSDKKLPRAFLGRLVGWIIKAKLYDDVPWKKNLPTAPNFIIKDVRNFENEKQGLINLVDTFYKAGPDGISKHPHPFFGSFTPEQWGQSMYKHLDHHLQQFGA